MTPGEQVRDFTDVAVVAVEVLNECAWLSSRSQPTVSWSNLGLGRPQTILDFAQNVWREQGAKGRLQPGALPYRGGEVMRYVPEVGTRHVLTEL
jgi:nucleoside-diphosphate-sugar epimerase